MSDELDKDGFHILEAKCSPLWKKVNYLNPVPLVINRIFEYDIRSANTSMLRFSKKMKSETLDMIDELPKHDREVYVGKMIQKDPSIREVIASGIRKAKYNLFLTNGVQDDEILTIKNDAVYIIGRRLRRTKVFEFVEFKEKHCYSLYMRLGKLELYYDRANRTVDVKGIKDEIVNDPDHAKGMILFFTTVMEHLVMDRREALVKYIIEFTEAYKNRDLPVEFYKEFNRENIYRTSTELDGWSLNLSAISQSDIDIVNGIYNYTTYVLPVIQLFI